MPTEVVRCDITTVSGYHAVEEGGVMQFGHGKGDPTLPQFKLSTTTLDLGGLGMPVATAVVSGETADDGLYVEMVTRTVETLKKTGLLFVVEFMRQALTAPENNEATRATLKRTLEFLGTPRVESTVVR